MMLMDPTRHLHGLGLLKTGELSLMMGARLLCTGMSYSEVSSLIKHKVGYWRVFLFMG
jgi:hypothetical protein